MPPPEKGRAKGGRVVAPQIRGWQVDGRRWAFGVEKSGTANDVWSLRMVEVKVDVQSTKSKGWFVKTRSEVGEY